jgi:hypothetical protein
MWLINKRRYSLKFPIKDIPSRIFFQILLSSAPNIKQLSLCTKLNHVKKTEFDKFAFRPKKLLELDLSSFELISETALARIIDAASKTMTTFKVSYKCQGLTRLSCARLSQCKKLTHVAFGNSNEYIAQSKFDLLLSVNYFLRMRSQLILKDSKSNLPE